jgi:hypothetical protein
MACASGNLALLYLTRWEDRVDREDIEATYPDLIAGLVAHAGVEVVMCHSRADGPVIIGRSGEHHLRSGRIVGVDPLTTFGPLAADSLRRLDGFHNAGDLTVIGPFDPDTGEVVSYEDLVGSHGGLGGWQGEPFLLHPVELHVDGPLIGAVAVHETLRAWIASMRSFAPNGDPQEPPETTVDESPDDGVQDRRPRAAGTRAATEGTRV